MLNINEIYCGDCVDIMKNIDSCSIDLTVTSPPYDNLRNYNGYIFDFKSIAKELFRITKVGGVVVWVVNDATINGSETGTSFHQALFFKEIGFNLHDTMIYQKKTPIPQFKRGRYTNSFEYMFVLSKKKPKKTNLITEPTKSYGRVDLNYRGQVTANDIYIGKEKKIVKKTKIKSNIWIYSQNNGIDRNIKHKAQFPEQLASDHIISWSNNGDLILDPMCGSGTTCKMAKINNRNYIGIDISEEYCKIAKERINSVG